MSFIYHITEKSLLHTQEKRPAYGHPSLQSEGFIHCSKADQLLQVANTFFKGMNNLVILKIDTNKLIQKVKLEPPIEAPLSGVLFPHIYGQLNWDAVIERFDFPCNPDGSFSLPALV